MNVVISQGLTSFYKFSILGLGENTRQMAKSIYNLTCFHFTNIFLKVKNLDFVFQGFASQNPMTQQRGGASGLSGLSQSMSQMEFSQDGMSQMMRGGSSSSQMGHDGMLSQDSTYQGDRHHSTNEGFLSQL